MTKEKLQFPKFMGDSSERDGKLETIQDYVLSWCFRMTENRFKEAGKPKLYKACRFILFTLLEMDDNDVIINSVKTWKQVNCNVARKYIDLLVEVELEVKGEKQHHAILIEDKYYTHLSTDKEGTYQIEYYKEYFDEEIDKREESWIKHYAVISCLDNEKFEIDKEIAEDYGFKMYSIYDFIPDNQELTESDIYNEFWLRWWDSRE